jgi:hypothetical protein
MYFKLRVQGNHSPAGVFEGLRPRLLRRSNDRGAKARTHVGEADTYSASDQMSGVRGQSGPLWRAFVGGSRWSVAHVVLLTGYCLLITRFCKGERFFAPAVGEAEGRDGSQGNCAPLRRGN